MKIAFSYDCEGNWGFIDGVESPLKDESDAALEDVYRILCDMHAQFDIPATFAFVALYTLPRDTRLEWVKANLAHLIDDLPNLMFSGGFWEGQTNFATVSKAMQHYPGIEIGSHGLTHRPIAGLKPADQELEFRASAEILTNATGRRPECFVFPRNQVAGRAACLSHYKTFRETEALTLVQRGIDLGRTVSGVDFPASEITSDFMFWKGGHRRHFSDRGWKRLWRARMRAAKAGRGRDRVIHVWSHPHNFLTDPNLPGRFAWLMELLNENRDHLEFVPMSAPETMSKSAAA